LNPNTGVMTEFPTVSVGNSNLMIGSDGTIWSLYSGNGFGKLDPTTQKSEFIPFPEGLRTFYYFTSSVDGNIWVGFEGGVFDQLNPATGTQNLFANPLGDFRAVWGIASSTDGTVWLLGGWFVFHFNAASGTAQEFSATGSPPGFSYSGNFSIPANAIPPSWNPFSYIDWGDGTFSTPRDVAVTQNADGGLTVTSNHTYRSPGTYVAVVDLSGQTPGNGWVFLSFPFTVQIDPPSSTPPPASSSTSASASTNLSFAPPSVGSTTTTNSNPTSYGASSQSLPTQSVTGLAANASTGSIYQQPGPSLTTPIGGGMGKLPSGPEEPLQDNPAQLPLFDQTEAQADLAETVLFGSAPRSPLLLLNPEYSQDAPINPLEPRRQPAASIWDTPTAGLETHWLIQRALFSADGRATAHDPVQSLRAGSGPDDLACAAFLAAYSWENRKKPANAQTESRQPGCINGN
jgi:hypothetical protein